MTTTAPAVSTRTSPPAGTGSRRVRRDPIHIGVAVWSALAFVFLFLPIVYVVIYSFNGGNQLASWRGFSTRWYTLSLDNPQITDAVLRSLQVALLSSLLAVAIGTLAGLALARRPGRWQIPFLGLVFLILTAPEIVDAISYLIWFVRISISDGVVRMIISHSVFSSAVVALVVRARMAGMDESLEQAAADLGASPLKAFRLITVPLVLPAVIAGGLLSFTFSLDNTITSSFVSTAGSTTWPVYVFSALRQGLRGDLAAMSTLVLLMTLAAIALTALVLRRGGDSNEQITGTLTGTG